MCVCDITLLVWAALPSCDTPVVQSVRRQSEPSIYIMQPEFWILYTYLPRILWIHRHMCQPEGRAYWHIQQTPNFWLATTGSALTLFLAEYNFRIWLEGPLHTLSFETMHCFVFSNKQTSSFSSNRRAFFQYCYNNLSHGGSFQPFLKVLIVAQSPSGFEKRPAETRIVGRL